MALQFITEQIADNAITATKLAGSIGDSKLSTITTANKVSSTAIQLNASGALESTGTGLSISSGAVTNAMLNGSIAFTKLADSANIARLDQNETVAGSYTFNNIVTCSVTPTADTHLSNKGYVDAVAQGLHPKESVKAATTANHGLTGTANVDGVSISAGDRILVWKNTDQTANGVYVAAAGAWARSADMNAGSEFPGASFFVREGSTYATTGFVCSNSSVTLGNTNVSFVEFTGAASIGAGNGIAKSGNTLSVDLATASGMEFSGGKLQLDIAASKAIKLSSNELDLVLDGSTLAQSGSGLKVADGQIANAQIHASAAIADSKLATISTADKVSGSAVQLATAGAITDATGLKVRTDGVNLQINGSNNLEIIAASIGNALIHASAGIVDSKLATIATANKVSGSALQLNASGALEDSSGIRVKADGVNIQISGGNALEIVPASINNALIHASAAIADTKLATIATADKVSSSAVQLNAAGAVESTGTGLKVRADGATIEIASNQLQIANNAVGQDKLGTSPAYDTFDISNSSTTTVNLSNRIASASWRHAGNILVFRNGQKLRFKASPSDSSEYSIGDNGSATSVTFGAALTNGDKIDLCYTYTPT